MPLFLLTPLMLVIGFISMRVMTIGFNQLRDALFARVGQHAVRQLAFQTFTHIHKLSLRFHLERRTGGLSRVIERGTKGIESIVRYTILNSLPVVLEFALYAGIFFYYFGIHLGAKLAPEIANLAEIIHLVPLSPASWTQYRPTWSPRCPNKPFQDTRIAKKQ